MERLGQYELVKRLAVGGMAELYLATSPGLKGFKHNLVLKKLLPELASDRSFVEMFLGEARIAGELNHPNIAHVYEVGESNGAYFIAMEYVDGPNLRAVSNGARRAGKPISPYLAAKIVSCVCDGLGYAHELRDPESGEPLRIVHRDISPENIIIARNGSVKVVDFGIAKASIQLHRTQTGIVKGKLQYMAPEQMKQNRDIDGRADIYSLGVVLYELLSGARPHVAKDDVSLAEAVLLRDPPPVPLVRRCPLLPKQLLAIVDQALAWEADERYQSCRELQSDLDNLLHGADRLTGSQDLAKLVADLQADPTWEDSAVTKAASSSPGGQVPVERTLITEQPSVPTEAEAPRSRWPVVATAILAVLVGGAGILAYELKARSLEKAAASAGPGPAPAPSPAPPPVEAPFGRQVPVPPQPEAAVADAVPRATITVDSRPPATVRIGESAGRSPFTAEVEPGEVKIEVSDPKEGIARVERVKIQAGEHLTRDFRFAKAEVLFRSVPEARVFVDGRQIRGPGPDGDVTPIKTFLYEGKHDVRFQCVTGKEDRPVVTVLPSTQRLVVDGRCARK